MPLVLLPPLAIAAGAALSLAAGHRASASTRLEARRVVQLFAALALYPAALFASLAAPAWSTLGLLGPSASATPVVVVLSAVGAALVVPAFERSAPRSEAGARESRALAVLLAALACAAAIVLALGDRLAVVEVSRHGMARAATEPLGESALAAQLAWLVVVLLAAFAWTAASLRGLAARVDRRG